MCFVNFAASALPDTELGDVRLHDVSSLSVLERDLAQFARQRTHTEAEIDEMKARVRQSEVEARLRQSEVRFKSAKFK